MQTIIYLLLTLCHMTCIAESWPDPTRSTTILAQKDQISWIFFVVSIIFVAQSFIEHKLFDMYNNKI